jgi:hypothetical protein
MMIHVHAHSVIEALAAPGLRVPSPASNCTGFPFRRRGAGHCAWRAHNGELDRGHALAHMLATAAVGEVEDDRP